MNNDKQVHSSLLYRVLGIEEGFLKELFLPFLFFLLFRTFLLDYQKVASSSMAPTLFRGDIVLVEKYAYGYSPLSICLPAYMTNRLLSQAVRSIKPSLATNNEVAAGWVPYYYIQDIKAGEIVCFADPRTGVQYIKRAGGVSGDILQMRDGRFIRNDIECAQEHIKLNEYESDFGEMQQYEMYREYMTDNVYYTVQYLTRGDQFRKMYDNTEKFMVPAATLDRGVYFSCIGDNRRCSGDYRSGREMPRAIPQEWATGRAIAVIGSSILLFTQHDKVSGEEQSWFEWLIQAPWYLFATIIAILMYPSRIGIRVR